MRLRSLSLDRFGHFTDRQFDFGESTDKPDFHIIYGSNEAGKTTTMEAVLRLFYGFPTRENYDFKHQRKNLQISAQLDINGQLRQFTRLPKRTASLLDQTGTALPETALANYLAGLSEDDYRKLLCLDDATIETGGDDIAQARGDIGQLLFSAAAGVADLTSVLSEARATADELWKKRATKTRAAVLKRELSEVEGEIRQLDVSANKWRELKKHYADAQSVEASARDVLKRHRVTESLIEAKRRALPTLSEINTLLTRTSAYANYPELLDFDPELLVRLQSDEKQLTADIERLTTVITDTESQLENLQRNPDLAALSTRLDELDDLRARDVTAGHDIERRRKEIENQLSAMQSAARDLGAGDNIDLQSLVLSADDIQRLATARDAVRATESLLAIETREVTDLSEHCDTARQEAAKASVDTTTEQGIGHLLASYDADHLAPAYSSAQLSLATAELAVKKALNALSVGPTHFDAIPTLTTTSLKAQKWVDDYAELERKIAKDDSAVANFMEDIAARQAQIKTLQTDRSLIPDSKVGSLKDERDQLWQVHKADLNPHTATAFEQAMTEHDSAMDLRVSNASDLGELRQNEQSLAEIQARAEQTRTHLAALHNDKATIVNAVNHAATEAGLAGLTTPMLPTEWLEWVEKYVVATEATRELAELKHRHQSELDRGQKLYEALCNYLNLDSLDFDGALLKARALDNEERDAVNAAAAANKKLIECEEQLARRQTKKQKAEQDHLKATQDWTNLLTDLMGDASLQDALLRSLDPLRQLREHNDIRTKTTQRVDAMENDQAQFYKAIGSLCQSHGADMGDSAASTYDVLRKQSADAQQAETSAAKLTSDIDNAKTSLAAHKQDLEKLHAHVGSIGSVFPENVDTHTLEALRRATADALQVINDRKQRSKLELEVITELNAENIDQVRELLKEATEAELHAEAEATKTEIRDAEQQLTQATEARVRADTALASVTGSTELNTLIERKTTIELELESVAIAYLELSLGQELANMAIHRYRDNHRSGMMAATEKCFAILTDGAYPQLTTEPGNNSETLLAVDKNRTTKRVDEMSKGTRFQLYLALRAAAHEQMVTEGTSLPFFCDDIFETFDETRTSAACQVMEQIGTRGQAIYLTHHRHVVDIAQQVCTVKPTIHEI